MTECNQTTFVFPSSKSRKVEADFTGGNISSLGGVMLLKSDRKTRRALFNWSRFVLAGHIILISLCGRLENGY